MKKKLTALTLLFLLPTLFFAQLTIESVQKNKNKTIELDKEISLWYSIENYGSACECFRKYSGLLCSVDNDSISLLLERAIIANDFNEAGVALIENHFYSYRDDARPINNFPKLGLERIDVVSKSENTWDGIGATLVMFAVLQRFAIEPFLSESSKDFNEKLSWGSAGAGILMIAWPKKKKYYLKQPRGKKKKLWRIK